MPLFGGSDGAHDAVGPDLAVGVGGDGGSAQRFARQQPRAIPIEGGGKRNRDVGESICKRLIGLRVGWLGEDQIDCDATRTEAVGDATSSANRSRGHGRGPYRSTAASSIRIATTGTSRSSPEVEARRRRSPVARSIGGSHPRIQMTPLRATATAPNTRNPAGFRSRFFG